MPAHSALRHADRPGRLQLQTGQRGLSLIELVMLIMVLGIALTAILQVFIQATRASADPQLQRQALAVAESLMEEVQLMPFTWCDPDDANVDTATSTAGCASVVEVIGPEGGEQRSGTPQFDNVNDYNGLTLSGITDISGNAVPGLSTYTAAVKVANAALGSVASSEALQITVTVTGPNGVQVTLDGFRTRHAPNAGL
ncbi:type II secretion system protein [Ideonella azotifigens]|uniref:type II secretion system protein n=1 Tax=Ideonella azotifigens TaxID=513160 RepID=UPI001E44A187|nr:type II secretion system protein [Ideonella azotifigens]MCD2343108.1 type II secretion system protein [Ideonella azotifigens]